MTELDGLMLGTAIGWLFVSLVIVTAAGEIAQQVLQLGSGKRVMQNVNDRIKAWWVMGATLALATALGTGWVIALFVLCSFGMLREFLTLTHSRLTDSGALSAAFFGVLPAQYLMVTMGWHGFMAVFIPVLAFLGMPALSAIRGEPRHFLIRVAEVQWSIMVCVFCLSHLPALMTLDLPGFGGRAVLLPVFLVVVVQTSDTIQYIVSEIWGRRRIASEISSSRTVPGFVGSIAGSALVGLLLSPITPYGAFGAVLLAMISAATGFLGGLVMTAIKRDRGIRDWGPMAMGQGGFIDRLDSVTFAAPVLFYITLFYWG